MQPTRFIRIAAPIALAITSLCAVAEELQSVAQLKPFAPETKLNALPVAPMPRTPTPTVAPTYKAGQDVCMQFNGEYHDLDPKYYKGLCPEGTEIKNTSFNERALVCGPMPCENTPPAKIAQRLVEELAAAHQGCTAMAAKAMQADKDIVKVVFVEGAPSDTMGISNSRILRLDLPPGDEKCVYWRPYNCIACVKKSDPIAAPSVMK